MTEENRFVYCRQCGNVIPEGDRFCGVCGAPAPPPQDNSPAQNTGGTRGRPRTRRTPLAAPIVVVGAVLLLVVGFGVWSAMSPSEERIELAPGVYSRLPEDRVLKQWDIPAGDHLIPQEFAEARTYDEIPDGASVIGYSESCSPAEEKILSDDVVSDIDGYNRFLSASGIVEQGQATVAGRDATWEITYLSFANPWGAREDAVAAEYPNYSSSFFLNICIEESDTNINYSNTGASTLMFEDSSENPDNPPTEERNAFVPEAREEVHREVAEQYSSDIEEMVQFVEDISTDERDGETDLSTLPRSFEDRDEILPDPFQGDLAESDNGSYTTPETTSEEDLVDEARESAEEFEASEDQFYEEFGSEYVDAVRSEDWDQTYSMLGETFQQEFTEEEWIEKQQSIWESEGSPPPLESVTVEREEGVSDAPVTLILEYEDGTQDEIGALIPMSREAGEPREPERVLTDEEISELEQISTSGSSSSGSGGESAVEEIIRDHYSAIGDNDFEEAYSHFSTDFQSNNPQKGWIEEEESFNIQYSTVNSIEVEKVEEYAAIATVDVSFEDNTGYPRFEITWGLVEEDGEWKLDEVVSGEEV